MSENYFNTLSLKLKLDELGTCRFMDASEFAVLMNQARRGSDDNLERKARQIFEESTWAMLGALDACRLVAGLAKRDQVVEAIVAGRVHRSHEGIEGEARCRRARRARAARGDDRLGRDDATAEEDVPRGA